MKNFFLKWLFLLIYMLIFSVPVALAQTCGTDPDGDGVYSRSCDLTDQYAKCSVTAEGCNTPADCSAGECSERGGACDDAADCPINVCNNGGAACLPDVVVTVGVCTDDNCTSEGMEGDPCIEDSDCNILISECPSYGSPGACIMSQTCEAITQTCDDVATCSTDYHPTEIACAFDADCNGICTYTGEPCAETPDYSFGACVTSGATCITSYTCVGDGGACVEDADCAEVCDPADNCPDDSNSGQADSDGDDIGDACDPETIPCAADNDGDGFFAGSCDLTDQYAKCSLTGEGCISAAECSTGQCNVTGEACADAADCLTNVCNNGGATCTIDDDCPTWQFAGVCITGQTCDVIAQTCDDVATCSGHAAEHACTSDADCNGVCTYTAEPCAADADCSFGGCVTSGSTCTTFYTCEETGEACTADADCEVTCLSVDNCPDVANPNQEDVDEDGNGDVCDYYTFYGTITGDEPEDGVGVAMLITRNSCGVTNPTADFDTVSEYYSSGGLVDYSYIITPKKPGFSFTPEWYIATIPQTVIQPYDFTATAD
jgi:hypothetical protein